MNVQMGGHMFTCMNDVVAFISTMDGDKQSLHTTLQRGWLMFLLAIIIIYTCSKIHTARTAKRRGALVGCVIVATALLISLSNNFL